MAIRTVNEIQGIEKRLLENLLGCQFEEEMSR